MPRVVAPLLVREALPPGCAASVTLSRGVMRCRVPVDALGTLPPALTGAPDVGGARLTRIWERLPATHWASLAPSVVTESLSRRVREAFDPAGILNPGVLGERE
jgi:hypothetical protein